MAKWLLPLSVGLVMGLFVAWFITNFYVSATLSESLVLVCLCPLVCLITGIGTILAAAWKVKITFYYAAFAPWLAYFVLSFFQAYAFDNQEVVSLVLVTCLFGLPYIFASLGGLIVFGLLPRSRVLYAPVSS